MRVQHRHIIYVQGYDPRGLAQYYRMFRTELRKFGKLYPLTATISRPQSAPDGETASWTIETKGADWQTRTHYDFLRTEDFIQNDLAWPIWRTVFHAVIIYWRLVFGGTIARFWKAHWRFATFITYPHFLLFNEALFSAAIAFAFGWGLEAFGIPRLSQHRSLGGAVCRGARHHAEIHRKPDLSALSAVRHDLDLGVLAPPAAGMGPAHRPLRAASGQRRQDQRCPGDRDRRPQFGIVPRRRNSGARAQARSRSRPARPARRAADHRRQLPDRRFSCRLARFPRSSAPARNRALDRLDRLPVAQGCDEFLSVRSR